MSVVRRTALEGTSMAHHRSWIEFPQDEEQIATYQVLSRVVHVGGVYLGRYLHQPSFLLHLRDELGGGLVGRSHHYLVVQ